jgi:acyl dehydratase
MAEGSGVKTIEATGAAAGALQSLQAQVGQEVHVSDWLTVTQDRVNAFAAATDDQQWIHVDPSRAKAESPYGATIAHGYLTLSLQIPLRGLVQEGKPFLPGAKNVVNYGLNKLRFPNAVRVGSRIRGRFTLVAVEAVAPNVLQVTEGYTVEIEGQGKPGCVAESVMRVMF